MAFPARAIFHVRDEHAVRRERPALRPARHRHDPFRVVPRDDDRVDPAVLRGAILHAQDPGRRRVAGEVERGPSGAQLDHAGTRDQIEERVSRWEVKGVADRAAILLRAHHDIVASPADGPGEAALRHGHFLTVLAIQVLDEEQEVTGTGAGEPRAHMVDQRPVPAEGSAELDLQAQPVRHAPDIRQGRTRSIR